MRMCGTNGDFDVDEALWVPVVNYVAAWREAKDAGAELAAALSATWPDAADATAVAQSSADGSGVVSVRLSATTARALAELVRATTANRDDRRTAS